MDVTSYLLEADAIISLAKLKTHSMMTYTGAVKNMFGAIPGTKKVECHYRMPSYESFADMLIDIVENLKPTLFIIDGVIGMEGDGPSAGNPRKIGVIIASKNGHEADLLASSIVGIPAQKIPTLRAAIARGLCPASASKLDVVGVNPALFTVNDFKFPDHINFGFFNNRKLLKQLVKPLGWMLQTHPEVNLKKCIGCGKCYESCPPHAISMKDAHPSIDREKCIRCFCCQELCPVAAMRIHRSRLIRFLK
jgi:uncharacterized protein (DUF362 family)/Pyruvate/2-oxoacid:ferredoxin oxidoreductase delta subunit